MTKKTHTPNTNHDCALDRDIQASLEAHSEPISAPETPAKPDHHQNQKSGPPPFPETLLTGTLSHIIGHPGDQTDPNLIMDLMSGEDGDILREQARLLNALLHRLLRQSLKNESEGGAHAHEVLAGLMKMALQAQKQSTDTLKTVSAIDYIDYLISRMKERRPRY